MPGPPCARAASLPSALSTQAAIGVGVGVGVRCGRVVVGRGSALRRREADDVHLRGLLDARVEVARRARVRQRLDPLVVWHAPDDRPQVPLHADLARAEVQLVDVVVFVPDVDAVCALVRPARQPLHVHVMPDRRRGERPFARRRRVPCGLLRRVHCYLDERLRVRLRQRAANGMHAVDPVPVVTYDHNAAVPEVVVDTAAIADAGVGGHQTPDLGYSRAPRDACRGAGAARRAAARVGPIGLVHTAAELSSR
eukprot:1985247-Rhodomonas_salina.2